MTVIAGLIIAICGVVLWLGAVSIAHAIAIFLVVIGVLLVCSYAVPGRYFIRRGN